MESILSVYNKNFTGNRKELAKVLGAEQEAKSHLHGQFLGIWQSLWKSFLESPHFNTPSIRDKWHRKKSRSTSERRQFSSIATIRIGLKMVGWFYRMLLPSAKCSRPLGRWRKHLMRGDLENHLKGQIIPCGAMVECHPISAKDQSKVHQQSSDTHWLREESGS